MSAFITDAEDATRVMPRAWLKRLREASRHASIADERPSRTHAIANANAADDFEVDCLFERMFAATAG